MHTRQKIIIALTNLQMAADEDDLARKLIQNLDIRELASAFDIFQDDILRNMGQLRKTEENND